MRIWILPVLAITIGAAPAEEPLFNGTNLEGWIAENSSRPGDEGRPVDEVWRVVDGTLLCIGSENSWASLHTIKNFTNFRLSLDYRWGEIAPEVREAGRNIFNSGIFIRSSARPANSPTRMPIAYQAQLIHTPGRKSGEAGGGTGDMWIMGYDHPEFAAPRPMATDYVGTALGPERAAQPVPILPPGNARSRGFERSHFAEVPLGQWNHYEIIADGDRLTYRLNGEVVNEGRGAAVLAGRIGLECENTPIYFRNISIRRL